MNTENKTFKKTDEYSYSDIKWLQRIVVALIFLLIVCLGVIVSLIMNDASWMLITAMVICGAGIFATLLWERYSGY